MKQICVISGKGGTGKTIVTASFAVIAKNKIMVDCDVDAADLFILLHPKNEQSYVFKSGNKAVINKKICNECGDCIGVCRFGAISKKYFVDEISCEGCEVCYHACKVGAIELVENMTGHWFIGETKYGKLVHAKLGIAEENSGKLVALIRNNAKQIAEEEKNDYVIIDGPPGIACPVIASLSGVDLALIVTEPTLSGVHDLERVNGIARHFGIKTAVCVNKYDLNAENTGNIKKYCKDSNIYFAGEIPFDKTVNEALIKRIPVIEYSKGGVSDNIANIWSNVKRIL